MWGESNKNNSWGNNNLDWSKRSNIIDKNNTKDLNKQELKEKAKMIKNDDLHFFKAKNLKELCPEPKEGEQWRIVTEKQFNAYAFILNTLENYEIEELYIAVYRINQPTVKSIIKLLEDGKIKHATFVISNFFNQTKKPEKWALMLKQFCVENPKITEHIYTHNHSKIVALKTKCGKYFVFEGSGNMSNNARIEQYIYEQNKSVFEFHKSWIKELTNG